MTVWQPSITEVWGQSNIDGWQVVWGPGMQSGDIGSPVGSTIGTGANSIPAPGGGFIAGYADKTVQAIGLTGGESVAFEGSNDGVNFADMSDAQGNPIAITAAGPFIKQLEEACIQVRPRIAGGTGSVALTIVMFARKTQQP